MNFIPVFPSSNLSGWRFLQNTQAQQKDNLARVSVIERQIVQFEKTMETITSISELMDNRDALSVALGSVGLEEDLDNKFFIKKILSEGTGAPDALANLLSDTRYRELSERFSFLGNTKAGNEVISTVISDFIDNQFQISVGEQNSNFRLGLSVNSELSRISSSSGSNDSKWFNIFGSPPLRRVFEVAFGLPDSASGLPIDDQLSIFKDRANSILGTDKVDTINEEVNQNKLVDQFLLRSQISEVEVLSSNSIALTLISR